MTNLSIKSSVQGKISRLETKLGFNNFYMMQKLRGFPEVHANFERKAQYALNLQNPKSFNEKLTHRRLHCRDSVWIEITDKVAVRDWLIRRGLPNDLKLIPVIGVFDSVEQLMNAKLPERFIAKAAWASGLNKLVYNLDREYEELNRVITEWYRSAATYGIRKLIWAAQHIPRRIIVEELLLGQNNEPPDDYKFFCFNGTVKFIQLDQSRFSGHTRNVFDREGSLLDIAYKVPNSASYELAENLSTLVEVAEEISRDFDFVRVDLYSHGGQIYFGELTQTPENGCGKFTPHSFDQSLGELWNYP